MRLPQIEIVRPYPLVVPRRDAGFLGPMHPLTLREQIAPNSGDVFPLIDSRTRYWRYFLLIGPSPRWQAHPTIGRRLLAVVRANISGDRARRGVGARLYNQLKDRGRIASSKDLNALSRGFRQQYGPAVRRFWDKAGSSNVLVAASQRIKASAGMDGFFEYDCSGLPDGRARKAFHRAICAQSPEATELADLLARPEFGWNLDRALAKVRRSTFSNLRTRQIALAWSLLRALFRLPTGGTSVDDDDDHGEGTIDEASSESLRALAHASLGAIKDGVAAALPEKWRTDIRLLLETALSAAIFKPPLAPPHLPVGQSRQRLFPDMRLRTFAYLLSRTA